MKNIIKVNHWCDRLECEVGSCPASQYGYDKNDCPDDCYYND